MKKLGMTEGGNLYEVRRESEVIIHGTCRESRVVVSWRLVLLYRHVDRRRVDRIDSIPPKYDIFV
jgi:hypothetical protein